MPRKPRRWYELSLAEAVLVPEATVTRTSGRPAIYLPKDLAERLPAGTRVSVVILPRSSSESESSGSKSSRIERVSEQERSGCGSGAREGEQGR